MAHTCRNCKQAFSTKLELEMHRDICTAGELYCEQCGERFTEQAATRDGWTYECPTEDCDGSDIGEDIHRVKDARITA